MWPQRLRSRDRLQLSLSMAHTLTALSPPPAVSSAGCPGRKAQRLTEPSWAEGRLLSTLRASRFHRVRAPASVALASRGSARVLPLEKASALTALPLLLLPLLPLLPPPLLL